MKKRWLCLLMAAAMALSLLPAGSKQGSKKAAYITGKP